MKRKSVQLAAAVLFFLAPLLLLPEAWAEDRSELWQRTALSAGTVTQLAAGSGATPLLYALLAGGGIRVSGDGGASWRIANLGLPVGALGDIPATALAVDPDSQEVAYLAVTLPGGESAIYRSGDGARSWSMVGSGFGSGGIRALGVARGGDTIYAILGSRVFVGINGGSVWSQQGAWDTPFSALALTIDPADPAHVFAMTATALLVTHDAGRTWRSVSSPVNAFAPAALAVGPVDGAVYAGAADALYKSSNDGATWAEMTTLTARTSVHTILWDARDERVGFVGTDDTIYRTTNGGLTWSELRRGLGPMQVRGLVQGPRDDLFVATVAGVWHSRVALPPVPTATASATATQTATATRTQTATATETSTATATVIPATATASATATATVIPATATPTATATLLPTMTETPTPTSTPQAAPSPTRPAPPPPTATQQPPPPTATPAPTATATRRR